MAARHHRIGGRISPPRPQIAIAFMLHDHAALGCLGAEPVAQQLILLGPGEPEVAAAGSVIPDLGQLRTHSLEARRACSRRSVPTI
jgi:hypothetical protein